MIYFNKTLASLQPSKSVTLMAKTKLLQKTDPEILNLTGGEPDFVTPKPICDEAARQLQSGYTHYTDGPGDYDLRCALASKLRDENHAPYSPENILITPGAKYAVYLAVHAVLNPGDEAMWLTPGWVSYPSIIQACGGIPKAVNLKWEEEYNISREALEQAVSEKTRLLIINFPNNPTGKVLSSNDRQVLTEFLLAHPQIILLSDEIYEKIIYPGYKADSLASIPELFQRTIIVNGFSKSCAMTGWRLGYLACCQDIYNVIMKLFQHTISCTSGFLQKAAIVALDCKKEMEQMRCAYEKRRDLLYEGIRKIPGLHMLLPQGAFYAWIRFDTSMDSETLCNYLLDHGKIAGVPGSAYGEETCTCVRFSFAAGEEDLRQLLERLEAICPLPQ